MLIQVPLYFRKLSEFTDNHEATSELRVQSTSTVLAVDFAFQDLLLLSLTVRTLPPRTLWLVLVGLTDLLTSQGHPAHLILVLRVSGLPPPHSYLPPATSGSDRHIHFLLRGDVLLTHLMASGLHR